MEARLSREKLPLVVIVGPTASGKTSLAVELAEKFGGEIICADSRTIYKGMDIGTAKPTKEERARVPHWGLDLVEPGERFTAADFKVYALQKIEEIRKRRRVPFLVGGTGLYIDSVVFDYQFGGESDSTLRHELEKMSLEALHDYCDKNNVALPENAKNKRYVIRAIERKSITLKRRDDPIANVIIVGITTNKERLIERMKLRTEQLFKDGVVEEAILLGEKYGWNSEAMTGNIYQVLHAHLFEGLSDGEAKQKFMTLDWRLAKRQLTWFRRNPYITWLELSGVKSFLVTVLAKVREA